MVIAQLVERQSSKLDVGSSILLYHFLCGSSSAGSSDRLKICMLMVRVHPSALNALMVKLGNTTGLRPVAEMACRCKSGSE